MLHHANSMQMYNKSCNQFPTLLDIIFPISAIYLAVQEIATIYIYINVKAKRWHASYFNRVSVRDWVDEWVKVEGRQIRILRLNKHHIRSVVPGYGSVICGLTSGILFFPFGQSVRLKRIHTK